MAEANHLVQSFRQERDIAVKTRQTAAAARRQSLRFQVSSKKPVRDWLRRITAWNRRARRLGWISATASLRRLTISILRSGASQQSGHRPTSWCDHGKLAGTATRSRDARRCCCITSEFASAGERDARLRTGGRRRLGACIATDPRARAARCYACFGDHGIVRYVLLEPAPALSRTLLYLLAVPANANLTEVAESGATGSAAAWCGSFACAEEVVDLQRDS